jgi:hypothetical protein
LVAIAVVLILFGWVRLGGSIYILAFGLVKLSIAAGFFFLTVRLLEDPTLAHVGESFLTALGGIIMLIAAGGYFFAAIVGPSPSDDDEETDATSPTNSSHDMHRASSARRTSSPDT